MAKYDGWHPDNRLVGVLSFIIKSKQKNTGVSKEVADGALGKQQGPQGKKALVEMMGSSVLLFPCLCHPAPAHHYHHLTLQLAGGQ